MKRRIETHLTFKFWQQFHRGLRTTLPAFHESLIPLHLWEIRVSSSEGGTAGRIHLRFAEQRAIEGAPTNEAVRFAHLPIYQALTVHVDHWHVRRVIDGKDRCFAKHADGYYLLDMTFQLSRAERSFCDSTLVRLRDILQDLGIGSSALRCARIVQETYVWVKKETPGKRHDGKWVAYAQWLTGNFVAGTITEENLSLNA